LDIGDVTVAGFQIGFVGVERLRDGDRLGCPATIGARQRAHLVLDLPERKHVIAVCFGEVVGRADRAHPTAALAIGNPHDPDAVALVAAISEPEALRHSDECRLDRYPAVSTAPSASLGLDERIALAMPYPAFVPPAYADKGRRRRTRKSRSIAILSAYRIRLRPLTSSHLQQICSEIPLEVVIGDIAFKSC
jgi:hypothetical protein